MRLNKNWPGTVYALVDGSGIVQYVGQTRYTLNNRLKRHLSEARLGKQDRRADWIRACLSSGEHIEIRLIERDAVWDVAETKWITHFRDINPNLLNDNDGGGGFRPGVPRSAETREKMKVARKRLWDDPEYREKTVSSIKAERNTPEAKQRLSEMQKAAWQRDEVRKARISKRNLTVQGDEFREKMRQSAIKQMSDPEARKSIGAKNRKHYADNPSERERAAEAARRGWADPVKRAARIEAMKRPRKPKPQVTTED